MPPISESLTAELLRDLDSVLGIVAEAGRMAIRRCETLTPQEKADDSYVTDLDKDMEQFLRAELAVRFPQDTLTGEEYAETGSGGPRLWSIDPIDGTGNLVHQMPLWAISVGLAHEGEPVLGVIAIPQLGETYHAVLGQGAFCNGKPIFARDADAYHPQDNVGIDCNSARALDTRTVPGRLRTLGSACCEMVFASCGRFVSTTFKGEHRHDVMAGSVIASEAGCQYGRIDGRILSTREFVENTPIKIPTFIAPPRRLKWLMENVRARD
jgi:myo-inositol-1(or 4)-monophosphatase